MASSNNEAPISSVEKGGTSTLLGETPSTKSMNLAPMPFNFGSKLAKGPEKDVNLNYDEIMEKWILVDTKTWTSNIVDNELFSLSLPYDIVKNNIDSPAIAPFRNHRYWRGDIEIRVELTTHRYQMGAMYISYYYASEADANYTTCRGKMANKLQFPGTYLNVGSGNDASLVIPYAFIKNYLEVSSLDSALSQNLRMCTLNGTVVSQLKCGDDTVKSASINIYARFKNVEVLGQRDSSLFGAFHQMMPITLRAAESLLHFINNGSSNHDLPSLTRSANHVVPTATTSMCYGKNDVKQLNSLRLDALGQTPNRYQSDSLSIASIVTKDGLLGKFTWDTGSEEGKNLYATKVAPLLEDKDYVMTVPEDKENSLLSAYAVPPMGVVSSMFSLWRGTIVYTIKIVCTAFHTGRLMMSYVPGPTSSYDIRVSRQSIMQTCEIREGRCEFSFEVPFTYNNDWCSVANSDMYNSYNSIPHIGMFNIHVVNKLNVMAGIGASVEGLLFVKGGSDFEVAIPMTPILGLSWELKFVADAYDYVYAIESESRIHVGNWRYVMGGKKCVIRYSEITDNITHFKNLRSRVVYKSNRFVSIPMSNNSYKNAQFFVSIDFPNNKTFNNQFLTPFPTLAEATRYADRLDNKDLKDWVKNGPEVDFSDVALKPVWEAPVKDATHQANEAAIVYFGESFSDLKDLLRRFQYYCIEEISIDKYSEPNLIVARVPLCPQGLKNNLVKDKHINHVFNGFRQGHIPIILSAYRYFKGSMRIKLVINSDNPGAVLAIQHIPNSVLSSNKVIIPDPNLSTSYLSHSFATSLQVLNVNQVLDIEIPYYLPHTVGYLQRPKLNFSYFEEYIAYSLGYLNISIVNKVYSDVKLSMQMFYSVGDDFEVFCYTGFPSVSFNRSMPIFGEPKVNGNNNKSNLDLEPSDFKVAEPAKVEVGLMSEMIKNISNLVVHQGGIIKDIRDTAKNLKETSENAKILTESIATGAENLLSNDDDKDTVVSKLVRFVSESFGDMTSTTTQVVINLVSNIVHACINPDIPTIVTSVTSILISIFAATVKSMSYISNFLMKVLRTVSEKSLENIESRAAQAEASHQGLIDFVTRVDFSQVCSDCDILDFVSALSGMVASYLCVKGDFMDEKKKKNIGKSFLKAMGAFTVTFKGIQILLTSLIKAIHKIMSYYQLYKRPDMSWLQTITCEQDIIKSWANDVVELTFPAHKELVKKDVFLQKRVYDAGIVASALMAKMAQGNSGPMPAGNSVHAKGITDLANKILRFQDELIAEHLSPPVSREPFVVQISGPAGIGKSHIHQHLGVEMLRSIGYTTYSEPIFVRNPGVSFLNGLNNQPIFLFDDFLYTSEPTIQCQQLTELMSIKSRAIFNPNMASLEEKKLRYSPLILAINSNAPYYTINSALCMDAIHRRRDVLIWARMKEEYKGKLGSQLPLEIVQKRAHLEFFLLDPVDPKDFNDLEKKQAYTYDELQAEIISRFQKFHERENIVFKEQLEFAVALYPEGDETLAELIEKQKKKVKKMDTDLKSSLEADAVTWKKEFMARIVDGNMTEKKSPISEVVDTIAVANDLISLSEVSHQGKRTDVKVDNEKPSTSKQATMVPLHEPGPYLLHAPPIQDLNTRTIPPEARLILVREDSLVNQFMKEFSNRDFAWYESAYPEMNDWLKALNDDVNTFARELHNVVTVNFKVYEALYEEHKLKHEAVPESKDKLQFNPPTVPKRYLELCRAQDIIQAYWSIFNLPMLVLPDISKDCPHRKINMTSSYDTITKQFTVEDGTCIQEDQIVPKYEFVADEPCDASKIPSERCALSCPYYRIRMFSYFKDVYKEACPQIMQLSLGQKIHTKATVLTRKFARLSLPSPKTVYEFLKDIAKWIGDKFCKAYEFLKKNLKLLASVLGVASIATGSWMLFRSSKGREQVTASSFAGPAPQASASSDNVTIGSKSQRRTIDKAIAQMEKGAQWKTVQHQQAASTDYLESLLSKVKRNTFWIRVASDSKQLEGRCVGLYNRCFVMLKHHYEGIRGFRNTFEKTRLYYVKDEVTVEISLQDLEIKFSDNSSLAFGRFIVQRIPQFSNIQSYFVSRSHINNVHTNGLLYEYEKNNGTRHEVTISETTDLQIREDTSAAGQKLNFVFTYPVARAGMCGSILVSRGPQPRIVGIHVAGCETRTGYSQPIWKELVSNVFIDNEHQGCAIEPKTILDGKPRYDTGAAVVVVGGVPPQHTRNPANTTRIVPSRLHGVFPVRTVTAPLGKATNADGTFRDVLGEGLQKRNRIPYIILPSDERIKRGIIDGFVSHFIGSARPPTTIRESLVTLQEAILGVDGVAGYSPIDMGTSEGYPLVLSRPPGCSSKKWLFEISEKGPKRYVTIHPALDIIMRDADTTRKSGSCYNTIFCDTLKDCRIKPEKVAKSAPTRIFSMAPIEFTIRCKQYFGRFQAAVYNGRINNGIAIGINADSSEWGRLHTYLSTYGKTCFSGDYSGFGDTLSSELIATTCEIINKWYKAVFKSSDAECSYREILFKELNQGLYLARDCVYRPYCGIPSGCPITVEINSIVNLLMLCTSFVDLCMANGETKIASFRGFMSKCRPIVYGDDVVVGIHGDVSDFYNAKTYSEWCATKNIKFTGTDKAGEIRPSEQINETSFLKRRFVPHPHRPFEFLAPLPTDVIEEIVNWTWNTCTDGIAATYASCRSALDGAYGHGRLYYDSVKQKIEVACGKAGLTLHTNTWDEIDCRNFGPDDDFRRYAANARLTLALSFENTDSKDPGQQMESASNSFHFFNNIFKRK